VVFGITGLAKADWSAVIDGGVGMAFESDESTDDACERFSGFCVGVGVGVGILLEREEVIGLMTDGVVAVGANPAALVDGPGTGTFGFGKTLATPSNLCAPSTL